MQPVLSPDQMRELEARYMERTGRPSLELMERAAGAIVSVIGERLCGCEGYTAAFACGPGGNGGDGYAAARLFALRGGRSVVLSATDETRLVGDAQLNCALAHETPRCFFHDVDELASLAHPDLWVDALFGIGLTRPLTGAGRALAERMAQDRSHGSIVLSVDIPSGLNGLTGQRLGQAVEADVTISFEHPKLGHLLQDGPDQCGELVVASIGIPDSLLDGLGHAFRVDRDDLIERIKPRRRNTHKGSYGHLLVVAGSRGMAGAAMLCAMAALRSGVGLATVACPESIVPMIQTRVPCAVCAPLPEQDGALSAEAAPMITELLRGKSAVAIGPGLSTRCSDDVVEAVLQCALPTVIDADALNLIAQNAGLKRKLQSHQLITPHPGEAARLLGRPVVSPYEDALALRGLGCRALLKGATTVIAGSKVYLSASGAPGMAKGGSGDALTGVIGALLAQGYDTEAAGFMGSELHGVAGEYASGASGPVSMTAEDLIAQLKEAFRLVW